MITVHWNGATFRFTEPIELYAGGLYSIRAEEYDELGTPLRVYLTTDLVRPREGYKIIATAVRVTP